MRLALFPLSAHLLPGGIMPLRIFEPRYQRMIAEAGESGFALCMVDPRQPDALRNMLPIATRVTIIDFDRLPDGSRDLAGDGERLLQLTVNQHHGELIAAHPAYKITFADAGTEPRPQRRQ